jgi:uncharacterized protein (TIGR02145 family)
MKKNLLLMMMCVPVILAAQNGVTVSGLAINSGTVTFNVSWDRDAMPVALWSDSVWVFVDYNNAGKMERLPLSPGATLTATSAQGVGKVIEVSGNNQGVWVVGNARDAGAFNATVKLLTATANLAGACVYGSNYPPVGKYTSATEILFIGTPEYEISLAKPGGGSATVKSGNTFLLPCDYTLASFTDATGAPGIMKCIPMTGNIDFVVPVVSKNQQASFVVNSTIDSPDPGLIMYSWSASYFTPTTYEGTTFTSATPGMPDTYSITLIAHAEGYCDLVKMKDVEVLDCTAPGSTVTFTAFNPCSNATTGDYWHLTDERESSNIQTYKVKKLPDGHIWMVQDMKFGDKCDKTTYTGSSGKDQTGKVTSLIDKTYYGDCSNIRETSTPPNRGYFYDWAAVLNKSGAFNGSTSNVGCTGTGSSVNACQGICPDGWHVPTADPAGEFTALKAAIVDTNLCPTATCGYTICEGVSGGFIYASGGLAYTEQNHYTSSSMYSASEMYNAYLYNNINPSHHDYNSTKSAGHRLRCVMNF